MKRSTLFFALFFVVFPVFCQFSAIMRNAYSGGEKTYKVWSDGVNYRYEFSEEGSPGIIIFRPEENKTFILMPEKKVFITRACDDMYTLMNDPVQGSLHFADQKDITGITAGHEKVMGYDCVKKEYYLTYDNGDKVLTNVVWFSEELNFPLKITFGAGQKVRMELSDLQKWKPQKEYFQVPEGYTEVDERGNKVIPEPPAPEKWTTKKVALPFQIEVSRATELVFSIDKGGHYDLTVENKTDKPAKIIRSTWRDGKELTLNVQGPVKYRTYRLYPGEKFHLTLIWKAGDVVRIKVYEGTMALSLKEEE